MNKLSKNISKIVAIVTGMGMSFGAYNPKAMMENSVAIDEKKLSEEVAEQRKKEEQALYEGVGIGAASAVWLFCYFKYVVPCLKDATRPYFGLD